MTRWKISWYVYDGLGSVVAEAAPNAVGTVTSVTATVFTAGF